MHKNDSTKGFFSEDRKIIIGVMWLFQILVFGPMLFDEITLRKFIVFILAVVTAAPFLYIPLLFSDSAAICQFRTFLVRIYVVLILFGVSAWFVIQFGFAGKLIIS